MKKKILIIISFHIRSYVKMLSILKFYLRTMLMSPVQRHTTKPFYLYGGVFDVLFT